MKRILATILVFLYLSTLLGNTIHMRYCMGKLISWGFIGYESKSCSSCGMQKIGKIQDGLSANRNCCRDEHKTLKTGSEQTAIQSELRYDSFSSDLAIVCFQVLIPLAVSNIAIANPGTHAPPLISGQPVFLLNRNFRI
jgi:hypothetical protein